MERIFVLKELPTLKVVPKEEPKTDQDNHEKIKEDLIKGLDSVGPVSWIVGIARTTEGNLVNFGSTVDLKEYVFGISVLQHLMHQAINDSISDE